MTEREKELIDKLEEAHKLIEQLMSGIGGAFGVDIMLLNEWLIWAEKNTPIKID